MRHKYHLILAIFITALISGCALAPVPRELQTVQESPTVPSNLQGFGKVIFLNEDPRFYWQDPTLLVADAVARDMWKLAGTGRLNVTINGKGLGQINVGEYIVTMLPFGEHNIQLIHQDVFLFRSNHVLVVNKPLEVAVVFPTIISNTLYQTESLRGLTEPQRGMQRYKPAASK
jgi:hypothetical protein